MKRLFICFSLIFLFLLGSCSTEPDKKSVTVCIPPHPWEENTGKRLWYTLCWTQGNEIKSIYVNQDTREINLTIPLGETVLILAYPLGNMQAFGGAITPLDDLNILLLNQNDGILCSMFIDLEPKIRQNINFAKLKQSCMKETSDFRRINEIELVQDVINGKLNQSSVKMSNLFEVPSFNVLNGTWISENQLDDWLIVSDSKTPVQNLSPGIHRYYCPEENRILQISVDYDSSVQAVLKQSLL